MFLGALLGSKSLSSRGAQCPGAAGWAVARLRPWGQVSSPRITLFSPLLPSEAPEIVNYEPLGLEADMW